MTASAVADLRNTWGAAFIGLFIGSFLLGVIIIQTWNYFWVYRARDPRPLKVFIVTLVFLDCVHTILCLYTLYWYLILNFGNVDNLQFNMWSMNSQSIFAIIVSFMVQVFYARRLYILSKRVIVPLVIAVAASISLVCGFTYAAKEFVVKRYALYGSLTWLACIGLGSILAADILIALSMCWSLYHKRTGFARTDSTIMTLISFCMSSGLLTSLLTSVTVALYVITPTSILSEAFYWSMIKCHVNSLLVMLNSRSSILERSAALHPENTLYMGSFRTTQQKGTNHESTSRPTAISVSMHQTIASDFALCKHDCNADEKSEDVIPPNPGT